MLTMAVFRQEALSATSEQQFGGRAGSVQRRARQQQALALDQSVSELASQIASLESQRTELALHDPAVGLRRVSAKDLSRSSTGVALELAPGTAFRKRRGRTTVDVLDLIRFTPDVLKALAQGFLLSVLLELFVVLSPFYMQLGVDEAILKADRDLLVGLAAAFGLMHCFNVAASAFRSFVFQHLGNTLSFGMEARLTPGSRRALPLAGCTGVLMAAQPIVS